MSNRKIKKQLKFRQEFQDILRAHLSLSFSGAHKYDGNSGWVNMKKDICKKLNIKSNRRSLRFFNSYWPNALMLYKKGDPFRLSLWCKKGRSNWKKKIKNSIKATEDEIKVYEISFTVSISDLSSVLHMPLTN